MDVEIISREWLDKEKNAQLKDVIYEKTGFTILSFNVLGFGYLENQFPEMADVLNESVRRDLFFQELKRCCANIVLLYECNNVRTFWDPLMKSLGFRRVAYMQKTGFNPPNVDPIGVAAYITRKFILVINRSFYYAGYPIVVMVLRIRNRHGANINVIGSHFKFGARSGSIRACMMGVIIRLISDLRQYKNYVQSFILCGDWNEEPDGNVIGILNTWDWSLKSAYQNSDGHYTCSNIQNTRTPTSIMDYIFFSEDTLKLKSILLPPKISDFEGKGFPSRLYPSDHIAICAEFDWRFDNQK